MVEGLGGHICLWEDFIKNEELGGQIKNKREMEIKNDRKGKTNRELRRTRRIQIG